MTETIRKSRNGRNTSLFKTWPLVSHAAGGFVRVTYQDLSTLKEVFTFRTDGYGFRFVAFDECSLLRSGEWEPTGKLWRSSDAKKSFKPFVPHFVLAAAMREYLKGKTQ